MPIATFAGKGTPKVFDHSVKKTAQSAEKGIGIQSPLTRKPLSPVNSKVLYKANITNFQEPRKIQNVVKKPMHQKDEMLTGTPPPSKPFIVGDEENRTPKNMGLPVPTTPLTFPMLTAATPDNLISKASAKTAQSSEYSVEELRADFVLPKTDA